MYKLLIAEDEVLERKALNFIIRNNFSNVKIIGEAKDGEEALSIAKSAEPHIIIMDIKMPVMNGLQCQQIIYDLLPDTKTIILTAYDNFKFAQFAIKANVFDYLLKPAKPQDLIQSINNAISQINRNKIAFKNELLDIECDIIEKAIQFINDNYSKEITLEDISSHVHLNPQYFSRFFKSKANINFVDYLSKVRIEKSKAQLIDSDKNIGYIALNVGFTDSAYFSKVFKKITGVSPYKFRKDNKL
ncbi:response regulator [Clostridium sp. MSJ-11]|uniref:Response regulator n=1 Tax=Clostridium mobile TaxID=2841512 RepID=A0ABS6EIA6_9CLOT|nr:response regulator [Clostridium mobile]MBU5484745.1 response regulator [Clostridium mobile]